MIDKIVRTITDLYLMSCVTYDKNRQKFVPERCEILFMICHWDNQCQERRDQRLLIAISVQRRTNAVNPDRNVFYSRSGIAPRRVARYPCIPATENVSYCDWEQGRR